MRKSTYHSHEIVEFGRDWGRIIYALVIYSVLRLKNSVITRVLSTGAK